MWRKLILGLTISGLITTQVEAAVLLVAGLASVDKGDGFKPAENNAALSAGDRVLVTSGCSQIIYDNGYHTKLCKSGMAVVLADPPAPVPGGSLKDAPVYAPPPAIDEDLAAPALFGAGIGLATAIASRYNDYGSSVSP